MDEDPRDPLTRMESESSESLRRLVRTLAATELATLRRQAEHVLTAIDRELQRRATTPPTV